MPCFPISRSRSSRLVASLAAALTLASTAWAHASIVHVYGANEIIGHGYGVNIYGKFPRVVGEAGDAGADVSVFEEPGLYPQPPCGATGELGELDTAAWLNQAEGFGIPSAHANASVVLEVFQVNRDGGGPMFCAYSGDASLSDDSWTNMTMTLNMAGNGGFQPQNRVNETVVATFPEDAKCTGGIAGNTCVVRCRTGVHSTTLTPYRFGGCFAVRLNATEGTAETTTTTSSASSTVATSATSSNSSVSTGNSSVSTGTSTLAPSGSSSSSAECSANSERITLSSKQINKIISSVVKKMKSSGLVYKAESHMKRSAARRSSRTDTYNDDRDHN